VTEGRAGAAAARIALFGHPLGHSRSRELFAALTDAGGPRIDYEPVSVPPEQLAQAVDRLRQGTWHGANVTIPHKQAVTGLVDRLQPEAARAGAANVLYRDASGGLVGANTDGPGFVAGLVEVGPRAFDAAALAGRWATLLGGGGAARGVCAALREIGARIVLVTRDPGRRRPWQPDLVDELVAWDDRPRLSESLRRSWLIVQATPVGMAPAAETCPDLPYDLVGPDHVAVDLIYNPWRTRFLERAAEAGARTLNGWPMLVRQAAAALDLWLGSGVGDTLLAAARRVETRSPTATG
jgi:shikimate dehydrogenase